jgi:hypothetical protein
MRSSPGPAAVLALTSLALGGSACAAREEQARRALSELREGLTLSLTLPSQVVVGAETPLLFRVQNTGPRTIDACVGLSRYVWILLEDDT